MNVTRLLTVIRAPNLPALRAFYTGLLDLRVTYESEGFLHLSSPAAPAVEIAFEHDGAPASAPPAEDRPYLSVAVDDVDGVCRRAEAMAAEIVETPRRGEYDRYRLLLRDPNGTLLEIFTPGDPGEAEWSEYMRDA